MESLLLCTWGPWGKRSLWEKQNHSPRSRKEKQLTRRPCGPCAPTAGYRYSVSSAQPVLVCILVCIFGYPYGEKAYIYTYIYSICIHTHICYHIGSVVCICPQCTHICVCLCADVCSPFTYILCTHTHIPFLSIYTYFMNTHFPPCG